MSSTATGAALTEAHRAAQARLGAATQARLARAFGELDPADLARTTARWLDAAQPIAAGARLASATVAGQYVSAFRALELGVRDPAYRPPIAGALDLESFRTSMIITGPGSLRANLARNVPLDEAVRRASSGSSMAGMRHALNGGRETIVGAIGADPAARGWQRVTSGGSCAFCALLAAKGPVYKAAGASVDFHAHDGCHCSAEPVYGATSLPASSQQYRDLYNQATAGSDDPLNAFRQAIQARRAPVPVAAPVPSPALTALRQAELEAERAARRVPEQKAVRAIARKLDRDSPEVRALARKYSIDPDELLTARARVADVRAVAREHAARTQLEATREMDRLGAVRLKTAPRKGTLARRQRGEYDFLEQVSNKELERLTRKWFGGALAPDQMAADMSERLGRELSVDDAMDLWMNLNRRAEASGALRRGKLPSLDLYSGQIDVADLVPELTDQGYEMGVLFGDELEAAAHIARVEANAVADEAFQFLGEAARAVEGPAPYRMGFQTWEDEVRQLEADRLTGSARYAELVPRFIDEPGLDFEELYGRIVSTARLAGEEVPDYARIPWA